MPSGSPAPMSHVVDGVSLKLNGLSAGFNDQPLIEPWLRPTSHGYPMLRAASWTSAEE